MKYRLDLAFRTAPAPIPWLSRFLSAAPRIWQRQCSADTIQFTVCDIKQPTPLTLQVVLDVVPTALDALSDLDILYHVGTDPDRVRCSAALYVWLATLQHADGPMTPTWRFFWCTSTEDSPVFLDRYMVECLEPTRWLPPKKAALTLSSAPTDENHDQALLYRSHSAPVRLGGGTVDAAAQSEGHTV